MPCSKEIKVGIWMDDEPLPEHNVSTSADGGLVECWVPSEAGKRFDVRLHNKTHEIHISSALILDGSLVTRNDCDARKRSRMSSFRRDEHTRSTFAFGNVVTTDDENVAAASSDRWQSMGTITLHVFRTRLTGRTVSKRRRLVEVADGPVHELSKKAGSHQVVYQDEPSSPTHRKSKGQGHKHIDPKDNPWIIFNFHYAPMDLLRAQGVVRAAAPDAQAASRPKSEPLEITEADDRHRPDDAQPGPSQTTIGTDEAEDVKPSGLRDDGELADLEAQVRELERRIAERRAEQGPPVKREASPIRVPKAHSQKRIVIDLTDD